MTERTKSTVKHLIILFLAMAVIVFLSFAGCGGEAPAEVAAAFFDVECQVDCLSTGERRFVQASVCDEASLDPQEAADQSALGLAETSAKTICDGLADTATVCFATERAADCVPGEATSPNIFEVCFPRLGTIVYGEVSGNCGGLNPQPISDLDGCFEAADQECIAGCSVPLDFGGYAIWTFDQSTQPIAGTFEFLVFDETGAFVCASNYEVVLQ